MNKLDQIIWTILPYFFSFAGLYLFWHLLRWLNLA